MAKLRTLGEPEFDDYGNPIGATADNPWTLQDSPPDQGGLDDLGTWNPCNNAPPAAYDPYGPGGSAAPSTGPGGDIWNPGNNPGGNVNGPIGVEGGFRGMPTGETFDPGWGQENPSQPTPTAETVTDTRQDTYDASQLRPAREAVGKRLADDDSAARKAAMIALGARISQRDRPLESEREPEETEEDAGGGGGGDDALTAMVTQLMGPGAGAGAGGPAPVGGPVAAAGPKSARMRLMDMLDNGGNYNQDLVNKRLESTREGLEKRRKGELDQDRAILADRGLTGGGSEISALTRLSNEISTDYGTAMRDITSNEQQAADQRLAQALSLLTGMEMKDAELLVQREGYASNERIASQSTGLGYADLNLRQMLGMRGLDLQEAGQNASAGASRSAADQRALEFEKEFGLEERRFGLDERMFLADNDYRIRGQEWDVEDGRNDNEYNWSSQDLDRDIAEHGFQSGDQDDLAGLIEAIIRAGGG